MRALSKRRHYSIDERVFFYAPTVSVRLYGVVMNAALRKKLDALLAEIAAWGDCVVAFSGGVDSSVVARAAKESLGEKTVALTAVSDTSAEGELDDCRRIAEEIGVSLEVLESPEMELSDFVENTPERCYHCKYVRFTGIQAWAAEHGYRHVAEGSNADDFHDYRPGRKAVEQLAVHSPLFDVGITKAEVRELARHWGLSVAQRPSTPCLATRIAYGEPITPERLRRIDKAERLLRDLGFTNVRVRLHEGELARIEVPSDEFARLAEMSVRSEINEKFAAWGFRFVSADLEGFRSGSMNRSIADG